MSTNITKRDANPMVADEQSSAKKAKSTSTDEQKENEKELAVDTMTTTGNPTLRLHVYDHCPYCIRVDLVLGLNNVAYERVVYGYGDRLGDASKANCYDGGTILTGKKELPVLEKVDANGKREWLKAESMDIITWILGEHKIGASAFPPPSGRDDLKQFLATDGRFKVVQRILSRPRYMKMTHVADWAKEEDRAYAKAKYEKSGFDYAAATDTDTDCQREMEALLQQADAQLVGSATSMYATGDLGFDDLVCLPEFRTLSLVRGLAWPKRLRDYVVSAFAKAKIETYFDHQID